MYERESRILYTAFSVSWIADIPTDADQIAAPEEGGAGHERLNAHRPEPPLMIEMHVALLLQGGEQPMSGRGRQPHAFGDMGERHAFVSRGELVDDAQSADEGLNMIGSRPRGCERFLGSKALPPPRPAGLAWRFQVILRSRLS